MHWEKSLNIAKQCQDTFKEKADTNECIEKRGIKALELLDKSASQIPRYSVAFSGEVDVPTHCQLSAMLSGMVADKYTAIVAKRYEYLGPSGTKRKFDNI